MTDDDEDFDWQDQSLGVAAAVLVESGKTKAAALLLDARLKTEMTMRGGFIATLDVPRALVDEFDPFVVSDIEEALNEARRDQWPIDEVRVRGDLPALGPNWREDLRASLAPRVTNQASIGPRMADPILEDGCQFRSTAELAVYRALKRARDLCPADDSISIAPNAALVVPNIRTTEPDFLVAYRGRIGVIQVDGPKHAGRLAAEATRDRIYRNSGIREVDRIVVEDTNNDEELNAFVRAFLRRLARTT